MPSIRGTDAMKCSFSGTRPRPGTPGGAWAVALVRAPDDFTMETLARHEGAEVQEINGHAAVFSSRHNGYFVEWKGTADGAPHVLGKMTPATRQDAARWIDNGLGLLDVAGDERLDLLLLRRRLDGSLSPRADYTRARVYYDAAFPPNQDEPLEKLPPHCWQRQVLFIKKPAPDNTAYLVVRDGALLGPFPRRLVALGLVEVEARALVDLAVHAGRRRGVHLHPVEAEVVAAGPRRVLGVRGREREERSAVRRPRGRGRGAAPARTCGRLPVHVA